MLNDYEAELRLQNLFNELRYFAEIIHVPFRAYYNSSYMTSKTRPVKIFWFIKDVLEM